MNSDVIDRMGGFLFFLCNPNSALERLDLENPRGADTTNSQIMISFADMLTKNNRLKEYLLVRQEHIFDSYDAFTCILCNNSSILSTYYSNRTITTLCDTTSHYLLSNDLKVLLRLNEWHKESQVARLKIIKTHFSGDQINMQPFIDMDASVRPHVVAWMAEDDRKGWRTIPWTSSSIIFCVPCLHC